jgi:hypothetical protein
VWKPAWYGVYITLVPDTAFLVQRTEAGFRTLQVSKINNKHCKFVPHTNFSNTGMLIHYRQNLLLHPSNIHNLQEFLSLYKANCHLLMGKTGMLDLKNLNFILLPSENTDPHNGLAVWYVPLNWNVLRKWECNCQSLLCVSERHILRSRQCYGIPVPSVWGMSRTHQNGTAGGKRGHSAEPEIEKHFSGLFWDSTWESAVKKEV